MNSQTNTLIQINLNSHEDQALIRLYDRNTIKSSNLMSLVVYICGICATSNLYSNFMNTMNTNDVMAITHSGLLESCLLVRIQPLRLEK